MSKVSAKFILIDANSLEDDGSGNLRVKTVAAAIKRTAGGLTIEDLGVTNAMLAGSIELTKMVDSVNLVLRNQAEAITAAWTFDTALPTSTLDPTAANEFCRKAYVDSIAAGLDPKAHCIVGTTAALDTVGNGTWSQSGSGVGAYMEAGSVGTTTLDGSVLTDGIRVLVKDEVITSRNGIYVVSGSAAGTLTRLTRSTDFDGSAANEVTGGKYTFITEGTINADSGWHVTTDGDIIVDTDPIEWGIFSRQAEITAGRGLQKIINEFSVVANQFAGAGLDTDVSDNLRIAASAAGPGLTGGAGDPLSVGQGAGISVIAAAIAVDPAKLILGGDAEIDGDQLGIDYTPTNYTPDVSPAEVTDVDHLAAHLKGIDNSLGTQTTRRQRSEYHLITSGDVTAGYFTLALSPLNAESVTVSVKNGIDQLSKQAQNIGVAVADFDVLNTNELHINNTGAATDLSGDLIAGTGLIIAYQV